jgi:hypothetical protein
VLRREYGPAARSRRSRNRSRRPCVKGPQDKAPDGVVTGTGRGRRTGYGQGIRALVACRRLALQSREVTRHTGAALLRPVTGLCKLDVRRPPYLHRQSGRQGNHSGSCWPGRSVRHHADTLIGRRPNLPNSGRCELVYLCAGLYAINGGSDRHIQHCHLYRARLSESGASRRRPPGKGGPIGIARSETAQVLTVASGRSADRSRESAMGWRPADGRWPWRAGRRGLPAGASSRRDRAQRIALVH